MKKMIVLWTISISLYNSVKAQAFEEWFRQDETRKEYLLKQIAYKKVADIFACQLKIVSEYKQAYNRFKSDKNFSSKEMEYMGKVYSNLFNQSLKNVDALVTIVTAGTLRMSDNERLEAVDNLYDDMQDKLSFLRHFNNNTTVLAVQRAKEKNDINTIQSIYGINK